MSVDYYSCDCCRESVYEEYVGHCSECGHSLCTDCLINNNIKSNYACDYKVKFDGTKEQKEKYGIESIEEDPKYGYKIGEAIDDVGIDSKYCPFCSGEEIHNDDLLNFALIKLKISKDELINEYKNRKEE